MGMRGKKMEFVKNVVEWNYKGEMSGKFLDR
jgi:hypothetical protein